MPQAYRDVLEVLCDAARPLRAGHLVAALGLGERAGAVEGSRSKLKRLVPVDADGVAHRAIATGHERCLASVVGPVTVRRTAYRAEGARNLYPADAALNLPVGRHSHGLRKRAALEAVHNSFDTTVAAITRSCGKVVAKRQVR
ncbi:hypothetical protein AB0J63_43590 [Streptosporangium canum]|uniref:hypothetical protein n=1 Tax=Streptosporangium canum TaxID=324952 RepID=UPI00341EFCF7